MSGKVVVSGGDAVAVVTQITCRRCHHWSLFVVVACK